MDALKDRLRTAIDIKGITQIELAKLSGVSKSNINYILSGRNKSTNKEYIGLLARALGVTPTWLAGYSEEMKEPSPDVLSVKVPYVEAFKTNADNEVTFTVLDEHHEYPQSFFNDLGVDSSNCKLVHVVSDSMSPLINYGDSVLVDLSDKVPKAEPHVYAYINNGEFSLARFQEEFGQLTITRVNSNFPSRTMQIESFAKTAIIVGRIIDRFGSGGL